MPPRGAPQNQFFRPAYFLCRLKGPPLSVDDTCKCQTSDRYWEENGPRRTISRQSTWEFPSQQPLSRFLACPFRPATSALNSLPRSCPISFFWACTRSELTGVGSSLSRSRPPPRKFGPCDQQVNEPPPPQSHSFSSPTCDSNE